MCREECLKQTLWYNWHKSGRYTRASTEQENPQLIFERMRIHGVIRGGVVVPDTHLTLPEGTEVEIFFALTELPQELKDEFEAWNRASDNAWAMIDDWEHGVKS